MRLAAAVTLLLAAAACGPAQHVRVQSSSRQAVTASATGATPSAGRAGGTGSPAANGSAPAAGGTGPIAPIPGPLHDPLPGTYHQTLTRNGTASSVTERYDVGATSGGTTPVTTTDSTDNGGQLINQYSWRADGTYLLETSVVTSAGQREDCVFDHPILELPLPIQVGHQWSSSATCSTAAPYASTTTIQLALGVTGTAWQTVGGTKVATYVIQGTLDTDTSGTYTGGGGLPVGPTPYDVRTSSELTVYLFPTAGLQVHSIATSTSTFNGKTSTSTTDTQLTSLRATS